MKLRKAMAVALAGALVLTTFATGTTSEAAKKTKLKTKKVSIFVKGKKKISITGKKAKHKYTFTSKKKKIAKVSKKGVITGVKAGTTTIIVKDTWKQKGKKKTKKLGTVKVTVKKKNITPKVTPKVTQAPPVQTSAVTQAPPVVTPPVGGSETPMPSSTPTGTPKATPTGTPKATPTATPQATPIAPKAKLELAKNNINAGKTTTAEVSVNKGTIKSVTWSVKDAEIATAKGDENDPTKATITGVKAGKTQVVAEAKVTVEGVDFTVTAESESVNVADSDALVVNASVESAPTEMTVGDEIGLIVTVDTGTIESIEWTLDGDAAVVAKTETGDVLKAIKAGDVIVTAKVTVKQGDKTAQDIVKFTVCVMEKYNIQDEVNFWSQYAEIKSNDDGTVTYTKQQGDQNWQGGEFGFVVPRDLVGKVTKVIIKYKDATLTPEGEKLCGYVLHYDDETQVSWISGEDHWNESLNIYGDGEIVLENKNPDKSISTVRIYDGALGGTMTIESVTFKVG